MLMQVKASRVEMSHAGLLKVIAQLSEIYDKTCFQCGLFWMLVILFFFLISLEQIFHFKHIWMNITEWKKNK